MPAPRGRHSFGAGSRRGGGDGADADGARADAEARCRQQPNICVPVATAFLAGALAEKLLRRVFRREPRGLQQASYCMMMAPPPGPAHSIELRLTHGLCAGGGHAPPQHHQPAAYHAPAPAPLHSLEQDMPMMLDGEYDFDDLLDLGLGGPSPQPWQLPPAPPPLPPPPPPPPPPQRPVMIFVTSQPPVPPEQAAAAALLLAPPAAMAPPPPPAPAAKRANKHTTNEALRRQAFNSLIEELRVQVGGLKAERTKAEVLVAAKLHIAELRAELASVRAATSSGADKGAAAALAGAAGSAGGAASGGATPAAHAMRVASAVFGAASADFDSADSAPGPAESPTSQAGDDGATMPPSLPPPRVAVIDAGGTDCVPLAPDALLGLEVKATCDAGGAAPLLAAAAAALGAMPLALRNSVALTGFNGEVSLTLDLQALPSMPRGTRPVDVRDALASRLAAAAARRASGANVAAEVAAALGMAPADGDAKRRRTD